MTDRYAKDGEGLYIAAHEGLGINRWLRFSDDELVRLDAGTHSGEAWRGEAVHLNDEIRAEIDRRRS